MGYSYTAAAGVTYDRIATYQWAVQQNGPNPSQAIANGVTDAAGNLIGFYEHGPERADGAITGSVYKFTGPATADGRQMAIKAGSFKIDPDGNVVRFPLVNTKKALAEVPADTRKRFQKYGFVETTFGGNN